MKENLVILSGKRTPFGSNGGSLKDHTPTDLALHAAKAALESAKVRPDQIDHVIVGAVLQSSPESIYIPRHTGLRAGVPESVPALGVNRLCGSGFQAMIEAYQQFLCGDAEVALVGGTENMSMAPYLLRTARFGMRMGNQVVTDMLTESLTDLYAGAPMAITAENLAEKYQLSRTVCDEYALRSQKLYAEALKNGVFKAEMAPIVLTDKKGNSVTLDRDEHARSETTMETLGKLKPVFKKDGVVTAGNASGIVDGAAMLVVATESRARKEGWTPLARLVAYGVAGCDPKIMGIGPVPSTKIALQRAGLKLDQMDIIEINEAFAPQTLAVQKELGINPEKLNLNGGAIALGHPLAASGARIVAHLSHELRRRKLKYALGSACIGGGQGIAVILERL